MAERDEHGTPCRTLNFKMDGVDVILYLGPWSCTVELPNRSVEEVMDYPTGATSEQVCDFVRETILEDNNQQNTVDWLAAEIEHILLDKLP